MQYKINTYPDNIYACGKCLSVHLLSFHANYKQSIIKQISKLTQNIYKIFMYF